MKASPVQLRYYVLTKTSVVPRESVSLSPSSSAPDPISDWNGVSIGSSVEFGWADGQGDDKRAFAERLGIRIQNEKGTLVPYNVELEAIGYFDLAGKIPNEDREDIAKVNGASLLYGALREVLFSLTSRYPAGALVLPSVNFFDLKKKSEAKSSTGRNSHASEDARQNV